MEIKNRIYIAGFHYEEDTLRFVQHGEGRVVKKEAGFEYQYNLTDHLGNVRVTVADNAGEADTYTATIETANNTAEANDFGDSYTNATKITSAIYNHTSDTGSEKSIRLSGAQGEVIGLAKSLRVYPGDTISMEVFAKYVQPDPNADASDVGAFIAAGFLNSFGITSGADGGNQETFDFFGDLFDMGPVFNNSNTDGAPNAYLNYMLYDDDFILIDAGFQSISDAALEDGTGTTHEKLSMETIVNKEGYMYIYLSNEHDKLVDVFFDDFTIVHKKSPIVQTEDYYPFGLTFNQQTRENTQPQNYLYNGKELQTDLDLNWTDYGARMYMADIGRWIAVDPMADAYYEFSPYTYVANNPIKYIDPDGNIITDKDGNIVVTTTGEQRSSSIQASDLTQNADGTKSATFINRTYEVVNIFADNGTPIEALRLTSSSQVEATFDSDDQLIGTTESPVDNAQYDCAADCHGYTFTDNSLWINDDQVEKLLNNDDYSRNVTENDADAVIFKKNGNVVHSGKRNEDGTYNNNAGILKTEYNVSLAGASRGLTNINKKRNVEFVKKNSSNKIIDTNLGTVNKNGTRTITNRKEIRSFINQLNEN